jgi:hypothetical protein
MPSAPFVELAQVDQQPMRCGIEMRCLFRDPFIQLIELAVHDDCISPESDIADLAWE